MGLPEPSRVVIIGIVCASFLGCAQPLGGFGKKGDPAGAVVQASANGLTVTMHVSPRLLSVNDELRVHVTVKNVGDRPVAVPKYFAGLYGFSSIAFRSKQGDYSDEAPQPYITPGIPRSSWYRRLKPGRSRTDVVSVPLRWIGYWDPRRREQLVMRGFPWNYCVDVGTNFVTFSCKMAEDDEILRIERDGKSLDFLDEVGAPPWTGEIELPAITFVIRDTKGSIPTPSIRDLAAVLYGSDKEEVERLLEHAPRLIRASTDCGWTALHFCDKAQGPIVQLLIDRGARIDGRDYWKATPLHSVARAGNLDAVVVLLKNGADPFAKDRDGRTPADVARKNGHTAAAELLARHTDERRRVKKLIRHETGQILLE